MSGFTNVVEHQHRVINKVNDSITIMLSLERRVHDIESELNCMRGAK